MTTRTLTGAPVHTAAPDHTLAAGDTAAAEASATRVAYGAFALRLALGLMFIAHAGLKYFVFTLPGTAQYFGSIGLPPALAYPVFAAELVGGVLLLLGVYTRQTALALLPVLLGATWAHAANGWLFSAPNGGWEYPAFLSVAVIVQYLVGDGAFALRRAGRSG